VSKTQSSRWQKLAELDDDERERRIAAAKREAVRSLEATAAERKGEKKERRAERELELGAKQRAFPDKRYGVIYADPPWAFSTRSWERLSYGRFPQQNRASQRLGRSGVAHPAKSPSQWPKPAGRRTQIWRRLPKTSATGVDDREAGGRQRPVSWRHGAP
jgi:hypothetical protein